MTRSSLSLGVLAVSAALFAAPGQALADWRQEIGTFRIGIVAEPGAGNAVPGLSRLTEAFTNALGMKVEFLVARDYPTLIEAQAAGRIEYAVYSATAYALAVQLCGCVEPLVAPTDADGATGFRSVLIGRDGKVGTLAAMAGHVVAVAPKDDIAGSLLPLAALGKIRPDFRADAPFLLRAASASAAETLLAQDKADALFGWEPVGGATAGEADTGTLARLEAAGMAKDSLRVVWRSEPFRYGPHAVRSDLDPEAKRRLTVFLTTLKAQQPDIYDLVEHRHDGGFARVSAADYAMAVAVVRAAEADPVRKGK